MIQIKNGTENESDAITMMYLNLFYFFVAFLRGARFALGFVSVTEVRMKLPQVRLVTPSF